MLLLFINITLSAEIKVGIARKVINPPLPFWLNGYGVRDKPSNELLHNLWVKAIAIEETSENRVVIVTVDVLGLSPQVSETVATRVMKEYNINRSQLIFNSSHTHSGPVVWPCLSIIFDLNADDQRAVGLYNQELINNIVEVIGSAIHNLEPMKISSGKGYANFAINRRESTDTGVIIGLNPDGPIDNDVPVIKFATPEGKLKAVIFSYACHGTAIGGDSYGINGDYPGFANIELEKAYPGITAMFIMGCGGDINPNPREKLEHAEMHGKSLAEEVIRVLEGKLVPVRPPIRQDCINIDLELVQFDPKLYMKELLSSDIYLQRRAKLMLEAYNKSWDVSKFPYLIQAVRFNNDLTILALSGEVVVDYSIEMKKKYSGENLIVAGYCNDVMCYIPSLKVLNEGGYEAYDNMIYYGFPGPFADNVEEKIINAIDHLMKKIGVRPL